MVVVVDVRVVIVVVVGVVMVVVEDVGVVMVVVEDVGVVMVVVEDVGVVMVVCGCESGDGCSCPCELRLQSVQTPIMTLLSPPLLLLSLVRPLFTLLLLTGRLMQSRDSGSATLMYTSELG